MKNKTVTKVSRLRKCDNKMQFGVLDWVLEQKEDTNRRTGKVQIKSGVNSNVAIPKLVSHFGQMNHHNRRH